MKREGHTKGQRESEREREGEGNREKGGLVAIRNEARKIGRSRPCTSQALLKSTKVVDDRLRSA